MINSIKSDKVHQHQQDYVEDLKQKGLWGGLTVAQAFVESIRDLGYRNTATATNELIDNAGEAGAENVHVAFGYTGKSRKPSSLVTIDDGVGMVPDMIRASVVWGGTDRHGS